MIQRFFIENSIMRLIIAASYLALIWVWKVAIVLPSLVAVAMTFHDPPDWTWPLPMYMPPISDRSKELRISGIFMEGMAGMMRVTVTFAPGIGFPAESVRAAWKLFSSPPLGGSGSMVRLSLAAAAV